MKKRLPPPVFSLLALFAFALPASAQIFVQHDAAGANTGASWSDAYSDLQTALTAAPANTEIWIAAGVYKPAGPGGAPTSTFLMNKTLRLLGGFAGTETDADQRDPAANPTVLSGDLNGNDVDDDFTSAVRADNVIHVLSITAAVTADAAVDGFRIEGGQADGGGSANGGGVFCQGAPALRNCTFRQNFCTGSGAGLYVAGPGAQGLLVEQCRFEKNKAAAPSGNASGGGILVSNVKGEGIYVALCEFVDNRADWAGGLSIVNSNGVVDGATFSGNFTERQGGGMRVYYQEGHDDLYFRVQDCTFENNRASFGGGLYFLLLNERCVIDVLFCNFVGNAVEPMLAGWGQSYGGLGIVAAGPPAGDIDIVIDGCVFEENSSTGNHSAFGLETYGQHIDLNLGTSTFRENVNTGFFATAGIWPYASGSVDAVIGNCLFENNNSPYSAGLDLGPYAGTNHYHVHSCRFLNNHATYLGGALTLFSSIGSTADFNVSNCEMTGNTAGERAGAIWILTNSDDFQARLDQCEIRNNQSPWGSAVGAFWTSDIPAGIPVGAVVSLESSLVAGNTGGAAIALDSFPGLRLLNSTVAGNHGGLLLSDSGGVTLQNTILYNPGYPEYQAGTADVAFASNGGNLVGDGSLAGFLLPSDLQNLDPLFIGGGDYRLAPGSPCIDAGVDLANLPVYDLDGNIRVFGAAADIGAYEFGYSPVREAIAGELGIFPNPASDFIALQWPEPLAQNLDVSLCDSRGILVRRFFAATGQPISIADLPAGVFTLRAVVGQRVFVGRFVRQ